MSTTTNPAPCWVVRNAGGEPYDEEWDGHFDTAEEAQAAIDEILDDICDYSDEALAAETVGMTYDQREKWIASGRRRRAEMESLHPVQSTVACYTVRCTRCGEEPEGDYPGTIHWGGGLGVEFDAPEYDFTVVDGEHYCDDCKLDVLCVECGKVRGPDGDAAELMCAACVDAEKAKPGPLDVPLFEDATATAEPVNAYFDAVKRAVTA